jgi:hypothetical protein
MKPLVSAVVVTGRGGSLLGAASPREHWFRPLSSPPGPPRDGGWQARCLEALERWITVKSHSALSVLETWRTAPSSTKSIIGAAERRAAIAVERWLGALAAQQAAVRALHKNPLEECLRALTDQSLAPVDYEILVIDEAASNTTRGLVSRLAADHPQIAFNYIPVAARPGAATTRQISWRPSQADLVAFTRDDCVPDRFWLEAGVGAFQGPEAEGIVFADGRIEGARAPVQCNCFVRRAALLAVDGLDVGRLRHRFGAQAFAHVPQATVRRPMPLVSAPHAAAHRPLHVASLGAATLGLVLRRPGLVLAGIAGWIALTHRHRSQDERTRRGGRVRKPGEEATSPRPVTQAGGLAGKSTPTQEMGLPS